MSDYHSVMKGTGETTQWEDIQVKLGNYQPREKPKPPPKFEPEKEANERTTGFLDGRDEGELSDLEDGYDDDRFLEDYRRKRLAEMRGAQDARLRRLHEGPAEVLFIRRDDFVKQVTEASLATPEHARGRWVVVFLFKDGLEGCARMAECVEALCGKYRRTKFVKMVSTDCIARYPDSFLPTLIVYRDGKPVKTIEGLALFGGTKRITPESVAFELNKLGSVCSLGGGEDGEDGAGDKASQEDIVRSAVQRMIKEREDATFSDEEEDLLDD